MTDIPKHMKSETLVNNICKSDFKIILEHNAWFLDFLFDKL